MSGGTVAPNFLDMSDEEVMNMSEPPALTGTGAPDEGTTTTTPATADVVEGAGEGTGEKQAGESATTSADAGDDENKNEGKAQGENQGEGNGTAAGDGEGANDAAAGTAAKEAATEQGAAAKAGEGEKKEESKEAKETAAAETAKTVDYEAEYKRLLAPFKANGRDIQVNSVDDAVALMQMGANYNKKMAALKPNLKLLKMLENNGLLSEEKLSFLIDVDKKVPGAISKLVKDSGIDPMDIDADKASAYKQSTAYAVDDREIELDTVLDEIKDSSTYTRTLDVVSNKWDVASKQVIAQAPQLLKVIDGHMANGIYDLISKEVERERVFGRLKGLTDFEAYRQVGDAIQARGGFNHLVQGKAQEQKATVPQQPVIVQPKPKVEDGKLNEKRRAASSTQPAAPSGTPADFNPLAMSDEEFGKLAEKRYR